MTRRVYSSEHGACCPGCGWPEADCRCSKKEAAPPGDGVVRVGRETKGRRGKGVTMIRGVPLSGDELKQLAAELKRLCGSGGSLRDGVIEIQGDHRDRIVALLAGRGWQVKRAGG